MVLKQIPGGGPLTSPGASQPSLTVEEQSLPVSGGVCKAQEWIHRSLCMTTHII